jgi:SAM-dependent methyltransferase
MQMTDVVAQNLRAWNEVAPRHAELNFEKTKDILASTAAHFIDDEFRSYLEKIGVAGKVIAQFNCNNGRELISSVQLGARKGIGFDFSHQFIGQARTLGAAAHVDVEFVETDIYAVPASYNEVADILILTSGALCWMPDLPRYFDVARRILKPNGAVVIYETHPFIEMFKLDRERPSGEPLVPHYSYFMSEPVRSNNGLDYYSNTKFGEEVVYWFHHTISYIIQSTIDSGFVVQRFCEFAHDTDSGYPSLRQSGVKLPMSYLLHAQKGSV